MEPQYTVHLAGVKKTQVEDQIELRGKLHRAIKASLEVLSERKITQAERVAAWAKLTVKQEDDDD